MNAKAITPKLFEIVEPVARDAGYELVDLGFVREGAGWVVRVYIDHLPGSAPEGSGVGLPDCEALSRELSAVLDVEDPIPCPYSLEVSSPGLDRPLRTPEHFRRFLGQTARVRMQHGLGGRKNFKGVLTSVSPASPEREDGGETLTIAVEGAEYQLPIRDVAAARLVPDWDSLLSGRNHGRSTS